MDEFGKATQAFVSNPWFGVVLTFVLTVLGAVAAWRMTASIANGLLIAAWVSCIVYVFFTAPLPSESLPRILSTVLVAAIFGLVIYYSPFWTKKYGSVTDLEAGLVKQRAVTLASQMFDFLKDAQSRDPHILTLKNIAEEGQKAGKSDREISQEIQVQWSLEMRFQEKTATDFNQQFGHRLHEIRDQLRELSYPTPKIDEALVSPYVRTWNIQWSAEELNLLAGKIKD
jgi:hypothetical protein